MKKKRTSYRRTRAEARRDPSVLFKTHIPESLYREVMTRLKNPVTGRPVVGARARLVCALLSRWLEDPTVLPPGEVFDSSKKESYTPIIKRFFR